MKNLKYLILFIGLALFASCSQLDVEGDAMNKGSKAQFYGAIGDVQTRVSGDSWVAGDFIGIYAINHGKRLGGDGAIFGRFANVKYITDAAGRFTVASGGSPIVYPPTGNNLNFVAYYPWREAIADYTVPIDVSTQVFADIDLLYANEANAGHNKDNADADIALSFNHMLSKVVVMIERGDGVNSLANLEAAFNVVTDGWLDLANGVVRTGTTKGDIAPVVEIATGGNAARITAMVVPGQNMSGVAFNFSLDGKDYTVNPDERVLDSSKQYIYKYKMLADAIEAVGTGVIAPWETEHDDGTAGDLNPI